MTSFKLNGFGIIGLHGKFDIEIPIIDNRLILVGVNGLGKTTVMNCLYFALTDQWHRLLDFSFSSIIIKINEETITIGKSDISAKVNYLDKLTRITRNHYARFGLSNRVSSQLFTSPLYYNIIKTKKSNERTALIKELAASSSIPASILERISDDIARNFHDEFLDGQTNADSILKLNAILKNSGSPQVIYLPTYRRIEQDLKAVFPNVDEDELRKLRSAVDPLNGKIMSHIELVQFGMQDVEKKITEELFDIQRRTRSQLSNLTATYLQDIIRNRADKTSFEQISILTDEVIRSVLNRVEENTLNAQDKMEVEHAIRRLRSSPHNAAPRDKYLGYFFSRLFDIYENLSKSEENIKSLLDTCNSYLEGKRLVYNDIDYTSSILDTDDSILEWSALSSGEKQVVSLFTHLFLSRQTSQIVLIDEPELSLSVPWQKKLLPDISKSSNCSLLISVTHSPFIFANELDSYAVDMSKFRKITQAGLGGL